MPTVKKGTRIEDEPQNLTIDEIDDFLSTTARLTADDPFQVISDGQYIYVFRQSIAGSHSDTVYKLTRLQGGGASGDTARDNSEFVLSGGNKVPLVDNTLLLDRFILSGTQLQPKMEVRYKRSRNKTQPANTKDSMGAKDMEGRPFYEPTQELDFVRQLQGGRFHVLLLPTQIANIQRWQIFTHNSATSKIDSFNIERAADGLFNTKGTIYYTSPEPEYQYSVYERRAGIDPFTNEELVPIISTEGGAESALSFDGTDDYVDLGNPAELKITGNQTIEMWVKPMSFANRQSLFCKAYNGEGAITLEVDGKLSYYYGTGGDNPSGTNIDPDTFQGILSSFGLVRDEWSHIAIVRDFESKILSCYIDGTAAGEEILTKTSATAGEENVFLGKGYAGHFNGSIDEVRIWNRARSADEIKEDRHHRLIGREPGLVGYWRFDENTGTTVYDQTDSANNGTISGATWVTSDALIGSHPGMSRDSFSFSNRTIASGLTAVQYFQQEDAQGDNGQETKPMKTNARVMLAVATDGADASGNTTTNKYVAALDLAVSREGKLAQVPDNLSLNWLNRTDLGGDSIESSFTEVASLEQEVSQFKQKIKTLTEEIELLKGVTNTLQLLREEKEIKQSRLQELRPTRTVTIFGITAEIDLRTQSPYSFGNFFGSDSETNQLVDRIKELNTKIPELETQEAIYNQKTAELTEKEATLSNKEAELQSNKESLNGQVSLPMPLLHTDSNGLTASGALLGFAHTNDTPQLFDSAMGKLALYFQGTNEQFFTAYYDTKTARAQKLIDIDGKKVRFLARTVGAESNSATINISAGDSDDTCKVAIANPQTGISETWNKVPRKPREFSKVLNGQAKPLYLGKVAETSGTVTELTLVEATNRKLKAGDILKIGDTQVTTSAAVPVNSSSIPINSASVDIKEDTPVQLVLYDYAANASSNASSNAFATVTSSPLQLENGSRQFLVYSEATEGTIPNGLVTSLGDVASCRWVADAPGLALKFDGENDYLALPEAKLAQMDVTANLTLEAWVKPDHVSNVTKLVHHKSASSQYSLGLQKQDLMSALGLDGSVDYIEVAAHTNPTTAITVSLWAKSNTENWNSYACLASKRDAYVMHPQSGSKEITFRLFAADNWAIVRHTPSNITQWHHYAGTFDGTTLRLYIDGTEVASEDVFTTPKAINDGNRILFLGKDDYWEDRLFDGQIDEVRIWNKARSEEQIQADKDRRLSGNEPGLVGYWHFEDKIAKDYSGNGNDGTIHGSPNNVASPLNAYKVFAGVGERFGKAQDIIPSRNWNHFALSYHQSYALNFDGNDYLDCGKNRMLNLCDDLTIETVIQVSDNNRRSILTKGQLGYGVAKESMPYTLRVQGDKLIFSFEDSEGTIHTLESPASKIQTNTVHKIAVTREKIIETTDSGADPDAWGTGGVADIGAKTGNFSTDENQKIDKAMKADYVASKKRGKLLKDGLSSRSTSNTSSSSTFASGQGTSQRLELKMYIDGAQVSSHVIEPAVKIDGNSQPLEIGKTGNSYFRGKIAEVKLWSRALEKGEIHQNLTGQEKGLVAWWQLEENEGNLANDFKGGNHAQIKGATWCKNPDVEASELLLYGNGIPLGTESVPSDDALVTWEDNQFTLGGRKNGTSYQENFQGILEEVRIWKVVRIQEQILDNIFTRLKGEKQDLLANYTFDEIKDNEVKDSSLIGNHLPVGANANKPISVLSDAPVSNDTPQIRSALAEVETVFNEQIASSPAVSEYGDMQYDSQHNLTGVFKRCYTYIKNGKWQLITGYKVGNLITEWVSQVQFDPQIIGYIEGAPPIPSENMTVGPITAADTDTYKQQVSTVDLIEAEDVTYNFSSSKENGFDSSFEASMTAGVEGDIRTMLAPLGFGVSFKAKVELNLSGGSKFNSSGSWTDEESINSGRTVNKNMRASMTGYWEDGSNLLNERVGRRYVPQNRGFALVQSETADVFALRLAHNKALISYRFQPNPDIPKDWNIISFPINPRYTKQGTLDGKVGYKPDGSVQTDPSYPQATQYGQYSYFKPIETYALKKQIDKETEELRNYYQNYNASPLSNSILKNTMSSNAGLLASAAGAIPGIGMGLAAGTTFDSLVDALTKDQSLPEKFATRNLANTYVWTADGGFYSETTDTMDVRQESSSGSYSFNSSFNNSIHFKIAAIGMFGTDLNSSMGGHMNMTQSKSAEASESFRVEVQVNPQSDLYQYEVPLEQQDWDTPNVDYLLKYDPQGNPIKVPGKVDAYRFMTFYLEPKAENFEDFYSKVVDPIWIEQSDEPNAKALREAQQSEKKPACWRIMHRVTFVSRILQDFSDDGASQLAKDARALNIESNWQLVKTLEPFVKNKTDSFVQLADAVRDALAEYLPELQPHSQEIILYMAQYYGIPEDI